MKKLKLCDIALITSIIAVVIAILNISLTIIDLLF